MVVIASAADSLPKSDASEGPMCVPSSSCAGCDASLAQGELRSNFPCITPASVFYSFRLMVQYLRLRHGWFVVWQSYM